ncbi:uncharacterized protein [Montipora capricornis]|uniref:uncharacterized protein n=1 Tax=Montipora capricornis TaxID=246305 RepID=UPI0035F12D52
MAKSRVTPLKPSTVLRLELAVAVVATNISAVLRKELKYDLSEVFWTDSKVVLGYPSNEARRFHTFVANRVQLIRDRTSPDQWNHVETKSNPADDASRGLTAQELISNTRWPVVRLSHATKSYRVNRPLWKPLVSKPVLDLPVSPEDPEVRKTAVLASKSAERLVLLERIEYFSDWHRAKKAITLCLVFMEELKRCKRSDKKGPKEVVARNPPHKDNRITEPENTMQGGILVRVMDLKKAERLMIKAIQSEEFSNEIELLQTLQRKEKAKGRTAEQVTKGSSPIHRLDPVLDDNGILRVGGRIQQADVPCNVKHPIILPKKSHETDLVIRYYHQQSAHQGRARTHAEIRASGSG